MLKKWWHKISGQEKRESDQSFLESGVVQVLGQTVAYTSDYYGCWIVDLKDIVLVGEYTNEHGPFLDDYFVVLVNANGKEFGCSFYAKGMDQVWEALSLRFGDLILPGLCGSVELNSRILEPKSLRDQPLYRFEPSGKRICGLSIRGSVVGVLTDEARSVIDGGGIG